MKRITFTLLMLVASLCAFTTSAADWDYDRHYDARACREAMSPSSACNKGSEPFSVFLKKFNKSKIFRRSRLRVDPSEENSRMSGLRMLCMPYPVGSYFPIIKPLNTKFDVATFHNVTKDRVEYRRSEKSPYGDGGSTTYAIFKRIDGKWYCVFGCIIG